MVTECDQMYNRLALGSCVDRVVYIDRCFMMSSPQSATRSTTDLLWVAVLIGLCTGIDVL